MLRKLDRSAAILHAQSEFRQNDGCEQRYEESAIQEADQPANQGCQRQAAQSESHRERNSFRCGPLARHKINWRAEKPQDQVAQAPSSPEDECGNAEKIGPLPQVAPMSRNELRNGEQIGERDPEIEPGQWLIVGERETIKEETKSDEPCQPDPSQPEGFVAGIRGGTRRIGLDN